MVQAMKADGRKKIASKAGSKQPIQLHAQEGQALTSSLSGESYLQQWFHLSCRS